MKTQKFWNIVMTLVVLGCLSLVGCSTEDRILVRPDSEKALQRQARIDELAALLASVELPRFLPSDPDEEIVKDEYWFDVSECLDILTGISTQPGYVLDYVYWINGLGGGPILYCREEQTPALKTFSDLQEEVGDSSIIYMRRMHLDQLVTDGTEEGYFDLAVQRLIGTQFYLYWHGGYDDTKIICTRVALERVLVDIHTTPPTIPDADIIKRAARGLHLEPMVKIEGEQILVSMVTFTKWGGFYRRTFTIKPDFPHHMLQDENTLLVEYDCGYVY